MTLDHRMPAMITALFSSIAVLTAAVSGASCNFLLLVPSSEEEGSISLEGLTGSFGVLCDHEMFFRAGDKMWELSRVFLILGLTLGSLTAALAWAVATFLTPTRKNWGGISVLAAFTAVIQVPIFILLEAVPCLGNLQEEENDLFNNAIEGLDCKLGPGSYLLIVSDLFYIAVTILTQCFDKPRWGLELDLWKIQKRGASKSRRYRSDRRNPNDEEKYSDAVHLTGLRARSIISSHSTDGGNNEDAFPSMSRILPAGEAKQKTQLEDKSPEPATKITRKKGLFARLFSSSSTDHMEVPAGETHSMSVDEEYDYESQLLHNLEIVRVMPQKVGMDPPAAPRSDSGEGQEVSIDHFDQLVGNEKDRSFQSFEAVIEEDSGNKANSLMATGLPNYAALPSNDVVEHHQMIDSPSASFVSMENNRNPIISSVQNILEDLRCEEISTKQCKPETFQAAFVPQGSSKPVADAPRQVAEPEPAAKGVRRFTNKFRPSADSNQNRDDGDPKRSFRKLNIFSNHSKGGYAQMSSDVSSDEIESLRDEDPNDLFSETNYFCQEIEESPPGLQLQVNEDDIHPEPSVNSTPTTVIPGVEEHEIKGIYSTLDQSHDDIDINSILQSTDDSNSRTKPTPFDCISIGSTHSDPGPISFEGSFFEESTDFTPIFTSGELESEQSTSFTDLFRDRADADALWGYDFGSEMTSITTDSSSSSSPQDALQRGRAAVRGDGRRKRRPISPVGSVQSRGSLLHMTIDEETEEDINNELDPNATYGIKRTLSCPEQRSLVTGRPISNRRDKSTAELLKKLERLKYSIKADLDNSTSDAELPPRSPAYNEGGKESEPVDESFGPMDEMSADNSSAVLSELLKPEKDTSTEYETADEYQETPNSREINSIPRTPADHTVQTTDPTRKNLWKEESYPQDVPHSSTILENLEANSNESWRDLISPMKDSPSKESWRELVSRAATKTPSNTEHWKKLIAKNHTPATARTSFSDETSETGHTRSTISYDSDDDSYEIGPRHIRSKSVGRPRKKSSSNTYRSSKSSSLSPTRNRKSLVRPSNLSSLARESRIRRLQQFRKGYLPLEENDQFGRSASPEPYSSRPPYGEDPASDPELTPKRKTAIAISNEGEINSVMSDASSTSGGLPNSIFPPSLLDDEDDEPCPEFDNIMDHVDLHQLDLQLIDLNRPVGAEYGADEKSM